MKYKINLLPEKEKSFGDYFLDFALHYLRYILILTQLVIIIVFFYRLQIDQEVIDLRESVDQKKEIINVVLPLMKDVSVIDKKTKFSEKIISYQLKYNNLFDYLLKNFPETINLVSFELNNNSLKISGYATNPSHLQSFFNFLKKDKKFEAVSLNSLKKTEEGLLFTMSLGNFRN